jgi:hypothetical protein
MEQIKEITSEQVERSKRNKLRFVFLNSFVCFTKDNDKTSLFMFLFNVFVIINFLRSIKSSQKRKLKIRTPPGPLRTMKSDINLEEGTILEIGGVTSLFQRSMVSFLHLKLK